MIDDLPPLRDVVREFDLAPRRALGQNFLFDLNLTAKIAREAGPLENVTVIEVGPGPGGLTRALLAAGAKRVIAIERDKRFRPALDMIALRYPQRLEIIEADALRIDIAALAPGEPIRIVANLPYNIGTALLVRWLEGPAWPPRYDRLVLMFQREVAERIVATPCERADYGRLAVLAGWRTNAQILFDVPASAFVPPPKILSSVVLLEPITAPLPCNQGMLSRVTLAAFAQRRKMLRQSLKSLRADPGPMLHSAGIDPTSRAEELSVADFVRLANAFSAAELGDQPGFMTSGSAES